MIRKINAFLCLSLLIIAVGCKTKKSVIPPKRQIEKIDSPKKRPNIPTPTTSESIIKKPSPNASYTEVVDVYINNYSAIAMHEMEQYKIPASITLAQGILESGAGKGELTQKANNHFGIKCHTGWTGERVYHDDDEKGECFRKYDDPRYSFKDHSLFLTERSRYQDLFKLHINDYKGWAKGLKKAGYATDPKYPDKLISIIERYNLTQYDTKTATTKNTSLTNNSKTVKKYTVKKGDTLYSIARRFNITVNELKKYNSLQSNAISIGQTLYLQPI